MFYSAISTHVKNATSHYFKRYKAFFIQTEKVDSCNVFKALSQQYSVLEVVLDLSIVAGTGRFSSVNGLIISAK